jgi:ATP-dependent DNA helicase MPH1
MVISDIESDGDESDRTPEKRQKARKRAGTISSGESEGEGDSLMNSEEPSEDSDASLGSLQDFIAEDENSLSSSVRTQPQARSSTTPPAAEPVLKRFKKPFILTATQETNGDDDNDDLYDLPVLIGIVAKNRAHVASDELDADEDMRPESRLRENRRRVVDGPDSDD